MNKDRILVVQVAALGHEFWTAYLGGRDWLGLRFQGADSVLPAVTCTVQGTIRTALPPGEHGMVMNGVYQRELRQPAFWEQSSALVSGERIWRDWRDAGRSVGMMFWQQSLGEDVDLLLSPWPIHEHGGGLVDLCHGKPEWLYPELCARLGRPFKLMHYWGPLAHHYASDWITDATVAVMEMDIAPDLLFTYIPHLDYALQKTAPGHPKQRQSAVQLRALLARLLDAAARTGYDVLIYGDYAIGPAHTVLYPNRILHEAGLFRSRDVKGRAYPNFHESAAFAVVDHEVAHIYLQDPAMADSVADLLRDKLGNACGILPPSAQEAHGVAGARSGDLLLVGKPGAWFAYPWWQHRAEAPDFASHVDIHNKPGYDPCELFFGWPPGSVGQNPALVQGTHGCLHPSRRVSWASTLPIPRVDNLLQLAGALRDELARRGGAP